MQRTGSAKLRWEGTLDDLNNQSITLWLSNLNLRDFSPYCEHFTAYPVTDGNLTFRSQNVIRNDINAMRNAQVAWSDGMALRGCRPNPSSNFNSTWFGDGNESKCGSGMP